MKVSELRPEMKKIEVTVKAEEKSEPREVVLHGDGRAHKVCDVLVGDETGCVYLSLWDESIEAVREGACYAISNAYTTVYRNSLRLNTGKYGKMKEAAGNFEVNTTNNLSMKEL
ncbi:MAG: single-stranded DNA-binding protein [Candidatus Diapherotrites archaeon]|uniref:Single-stranded DNA-binding protein n=1 Tax=Candidatus Iainarchaeum sp. TaxID=3101447 RepID=A0A8T3YS66_9ARCH|nr:single-stranded DNA-binding protein [Candidatus Diapherotrites archaeon]